MKTLAGLVFACGLFAVYLSCYAHTPTPPCSEDPRNPACVPQLANTADAGGDQ